MVPPSDELQAPAPVRDGSLPAGVGRLAGQVRPIVVSPAQVIALEWGLGELAELLYGKPTGRRDARHG